MVEARIGDKARMIGNFIGNSYSGIFRLWSRWSCCLVMLGAH